MRCIALRRCALALHACALALHHLALAQHRIALLCSRTGCSPFLSRLVRCAQGIVNRLEVLDGEALDGRLAMVIAGELADELAPKGVLSAIPIN